MVRRVVLLSLLVLATGCPPTPVTPVLRDVAPETVDEVEGGALELRGEGLIPRVVLDFDRPASSPRTTEVRAWLTQGELRVELAEVAWVSPTLVTARVPQRVARGTWDVHLVEPRGSELVLSAAFEVVDCTSEACLSPDGGPVEVDAGVDAGVVACETLTYLDRDRDGFGLPDSGALLCGAGRALVGGDCDDADPLTFPDAGEPCNGLDDDCDGVVDGPWCGDAGLRWRQVPQLESPSHDFVAAASFGEGSLWVIGGAQAFVRDAGEAFVSVSMSCPPNLQSVWAEPGTGLAELSGGNNGVGRLTTNSPGSTGCGPLRLVRDPMVGLVAFPSGDGGYDYVGALRDGRVLRWSRGETPVDPMTSLPVGTVLRAMHAASPTEVYAVGSNTLSMPPSMKAFRLAEDGGWQDEGVDGIPGVPSGALEAVWVLPGGVVAAVGEGGALFERTARGWLLLSSETSATLTGVQLFGPARIYVTQADGLVRRFVQGRWEVLHDNGRQVPYRDLTASSEEDLWAVGDDGVIAQGPLPR